MCTPYRGGAVDCIYVDVYVCEMRVWYTVGFFKLIEGLVQRMLLWYWKGLKGCLGTMILIP